MSIYINGFDRKSTMKQIKAKNLGYISSDEFGNCLYRSGDGNCCLVGCFIPDEKYCDSIESHDARHAIINLKLEKHMPLSNDLMDRLQMFHDGDTLEGLDKEDFYKEIEEKLAFFEEQYRYGLL